MKSTRPRNTASLSDSLLHHLNLYCLGATAAGVGVLALGQPAEAKIVYTKTHQIIKLNGTYNLDLNHDGVVDFLIQQVGYCNSTTCYGFQRYFLAKEALGNAVQGSIGKSSRHYAAALRPKAQIGRGQHFISGGRNGEELIFVWQDQDFQQPYTYGQWINVNNRYLGLKFRIGRKTHYGWARLSVHNKAGVIVGTLTGYAYETIPGKSIRAGQTTDMAGAATADVANPKVSDAKHALVESASVAQQARSLGTLALGAQGIPSRRLP